MLGKVNQAIWYRTIHLIIMQIPLFLSAQFDFKVHFDSTLQELRMEALNEGKRDKKCEFRVYFMNQNNAENSLMFEWIESLPSKRWKELMI